MKRTVSFALAAVLASGASAFAEGKPVPELSLLTWPAARYQHYYETSNYVAEAWRELGIPVKLDPQPIPSPLYHMWFNEHKFDGVMSVLSGSPSRLDPEFFTATQFWSGNSAPGGMNVGSFSSEAFDKLVSEQRKLYDPEKRREIIYKMQEMIHDEQPEGLVAAVINTFGYNINNVELEDYQPAPDAFRSVWNLLRFKVKNGQPAIKFGWANDQQSWNPLTFSLLEDMDRLGLVYDRLVVMSGEGKTELWAAEKIDLADDVTISVTLKEGLTFSDGKPVTADDVAFTYKFLKENEAVYFKSVLTSLKDVTVEGREARFVLNEPSASFISQAFGAIPILPRHVWEPLAQEKGKEGIRSYNNLDLVGSGPYRLKYWKEGSEIYFEHNPAHFMKPTADLLMVKFNSAEVLSASLRKGDIDATLQPLVPTVVEEFSQDENLKLLQAQSNGHMSIRYNLNNEFLANKKVRQALSHAIPFQAIIDDVLGGDATPIPSPIVPSNTYWTHPTLTVPEYDLDKAREMLKEAGFTWGSDGMLRFPE